MTLRVFFLRLAGMFLAFLGAALALAPIGLKELGIPHESTIFATVYHQILTGAALMAVGFHLWLTEAAPRRPQR